MSELPPKWLTPEKMAAIKREWAIQETILPLLRQGGFVGLQPPANFKAYLLGTTAFVQLQIFWHKSLPARCLS